MPPHDADAGPRPDNLDPRAAAGAGELAALAARETGRAAVTARAILEDGRAAMAAAYVAAGWRVAEAQAGDGKAPTCGPSRAALDVAAVWRRAMRAGGPRNWLGSPPAGSAVLDLDRLDLAGPFLAALGWDAAPPAHVTTGRRPVPGWHVAVADWPEGMRGKLPALDAEGRAILEPNPKTGKLEAVTLADVKRGGAGWVVLPGALHPDTGETYAAPDAPDWTPGALVTLTARQRAALEEWAAAGALAVAEAEGRAATPAGPVYMPGGPVDARALAYGRGAVKGACDRTRTAPKGRRSDTVNGEAYALARLRDACALDRDAILEALAHAGKAAGLPYGAALASARSGWRAGFEAGQRGIPPPRDDGPGNGGPRGGGGGPRGGLPAGGEAVTRAAFAAAWSAAAAALEGGQHHGARPSWGAFGDAARDWIAARGPVVACGLDVFSSAAGCRRDAARRWLRRAVAAGLVAALEPGGADVKTGKRTPTRFVLTLPGGLSDIVAHGDGDGPGGVGEDGSPSSGATMSESLRRLRSAPLRGDARRYHGTARDGSRGADALADAPDGQRAASAVGALAADCIQALEDAAGPLTLSALAAVLEARGRPVTARTLERTARRMVTRGAWLDAGPAPSTGGRPARLYVLAPDAARALEAERIGDAAREAVKADAARRADHLAMLAAIRPADMDAWREADADRAARDDAGPDVRAAAAEARGKPARQRRPAPSRRRRAATIAATPAELAAADAARVPDVPAWLDAEAAGMAAASGWTLAPPDGAGELARTPAALDVAPVADAGPLDAGAILEAAGSAAAPSAAAPSEPEPALAAAPAMPDAAMLEASAADRPAPDTAWRCHCGKRSTAAACWNCGRAREDGERPDLAVMPGGRSGEPAPAPALDADTLRALAAELTGRAAASERPALRIVDGPERAP